MSAIFPKWVNRIPLILLFISGGGAFATLGIVWYYFTPKYTDVGYAPHQPVPYSHKLHAGTLGMDCRYCHTGVEVSSNASIPPTQTCMNCHSVIRTDSPKLQMVRDSFADNTPIPWVRIHKLPDYVQFNHSVHVNAGVGCASCHGRVDQMEIVAQTEPLSMAWCLDCHRDPAPHLRPKDKVTVMDYVPTRESGALIQQANNIAPPENCSACHY